MKPRLFIFGDSWCTPYFDWYSDFTNKNTTPGWYMPIAHYVKKLGYTPLNFTKYLTHHYEVVNHSCGGQSNESIFYQLGKLPDYTQGDRLLICFTHPVRARITFKSEWIPEDYHRRREVDITPGYLPKYKKSSLRQMMIDRQESWESGHRDDEKEFIRILKKFLFKYEPVFFTWSTDFDKNDVLFFKHNNLRIVDEFPKYNDHHLGAKGNYLLYLQTLEWLKADFKSTKFFDGDIHT